ncbi:hypothetical protein G6F42_027859 [Rhizopus arrhizus]|nr:hypothetical protein G6F42_027859 [Rhizopus arrhizus]
MSFTVSLIGYGPCWDAQCWKEHEKAAKFFGDNDEFFKRYQMMQQDDTTSTSQLVEQQQQQNRASVVYLTTPDYNESAALGTTRPLSWRHSGNLSSR